MANGAGNNGSGGRETAPSESAAALEPIKTRRAAKKRMEKEKKAQAEAEAQAEAQAQAQRIVWKEGAARDKKREDLAAQTASTLSVVLRRQEELAKNLPNNAAIKSVGERLDTPLPELGYSSNKQASSLRDLDKRSRSVMRWKFLCSSSPESLNEKDKGERQQVVLKLAEVKKRRPKRNFSQDQYISLLEIQLRDIYCHPKVGAEINRCEQELDKVEEALPEDQRSPDYWVSLLLKYAKGTEVNKISRKELMQLVSGLELKFKAEGELGDFNAMLSQQLIGLWLDMKKKEGWSRINKTPFWRSKAIKNEAAEYGLVLAQGSNTVCHRPEEVGGLLGRILRLTQAKQPTRKEIKRRLDIVAKKDQSDLRAEDNTEVQTLCVAWQHLKWHEGWSPWAKFKCRDIIKAAAVTDELGKLENQKPKENVRGLAGGLLEQRRRCAKLSSP